MTVADAYAPSYPDVMSVAQAFASTVVPQMGPAVEALRGALAMLSDPAMQDRLDGDQLMEVLRDAGEANRLADSLHVLVAGLVARRSQATSANGVRLCADQGFTTPADLVARVSGVSRVEAARQIQLSEPLVAPLFAGAEGKTGEGTEKDGTAAASPSSISFPVVRAGMVAGLISTRIAGLITDALRPALGHGHRLAEEAEWAMVALAVGADALVTRRAAFGASADPLLEAARATGVGPGPGSVEQLRRTARMWAQRIGRQAAIDSPAEAARLTDQHAQQVARRGLRIGPLVGGTRRIEGELLPEVAAQLERVLDAIGNPRVRRGDTSAEDGAETEAPLPDRRTFIQKQHDHFAAFLTIAAGIDAMPLMGGAAPTLVITATLDQWSDPHGVAFLAGTHDEADSAIDISTAHHIGCAGSIQRVVTDHRGAVIDMESRSLIFPVHHRRAMADRDGGCIIPGCTVPASWCESHHVTEWQDGGTTDVSNGCLLCWHHHHELGALGWEIQMRGGIPWVRPPASIDRRQRWVRGQQSTHRIHDEVRGRSAFISDDRRPDTDGRSAPDDALFDLTG